jgi:hypothetical protein
MGSFDPVRRQLRTQIGRAIVEARSEMIRITQRAAPVDRGELRESITATQPVTTDRMSSFDLRTGDLIQAHTTESGARPHVIRARRAKALAFRPRGSGRVVIVKSVNHPGNPPRPWFAPSARRWRGYGLADTPVAAPARAGRLLSRLATDWMARCYTFRRTHGHPAITPRGRSMSNTHPRGSG